ncbi:uncharacterized mitochondrial protein AtMg00810-like [Capsicum annuum]|uniref:uncharacterized mitochondrial protein AtMg00810-like n=1 Tax=Capsicum annuum TaxID=4072 RepID=UPI001FB07C12|nr:uncharacterized mitochondrial protein AtMg00810-like [Capsicum annuum]
MRQPKGFVHPDYPHYVCKLHRALYGLKQSPRAWFYRLARFLLDLGCTQSVFGSSKSLVSQFITSMSMEFSMKDLGPLTYFLGVELKHNSLGLLLVQYCYITSILHRFKLEKCKSVHTPLHSKLDWNSTSSPLLEDPSTYRQMPRQLHLQVVKRIFRYLSGTTDWGLQLYKKSFLALTIYCDSDWDGCSATRRSTTGFCIFLGSNRISWSAKKQPIVACSSTEADYRALSIATAEATWVQYILHDLGLFLTSPVSAKYDNIGAIHLVHNPVFHSRTKHIALDYHFVRENISHGDLVVSHVHTSEQLADLLTKVLPSSRFRELTVNLHVHSSRLD